MIFLGAIAWRAVPLAMAALAGAAAHAQSSPQLHSRDGLLVLPNVKVQQGPVTREISPVAAAGMRAFKDQDSGQLRPPTPEEQIAIAAEPAPAEEPAVVRRAANGAMMARAGSNAMSYSVARRNSKGHIDTECVTGPQAASKALVGKTSKEHRHDTH